MTKLIKQEFECECDSTNSHCNHEPGKCKGEVIIPWLCNICKNFCEEDKNKNERSRIKI